MCILIIKKEPKFEIDKLIEQDKNVRLLLAVIEDLRKQKNELAKKGKQGVTDELRNQSIELGKKLKIKEKELQYLKEEFKKLLLSCPNIPQDDIPEGNKESNKVISRFGEKKEFDFEPKHHV